LEELQIKHQSNEIKGKKYGIDYLQANTERYIYFYDPAPIL